MADETTEAAVGRNLDSSKQAWTLESVFKRLSALLGGKKQPAPIQVNPDEPGEVVEKPRSRFETINLAEQGRLYEPFAWVRYILLWTHFQIIFLAAACVIATFFAMYLAGRGLMVIDLPESIRARSYSMYHIKTPDRDEFDRYVITVVGLMHQFDYRTAPNLELLKGLINSDIYEKVSMRYHQAETVIHAKGLVQDLHISLIDNVFPSVNGMRYSATLKGYLSVSSLINDRKTQKFIPYRAHIVVHLQPDSHINRSGYFLTQVMEFSGDEAARKFDAELKEMLEKQGLK